MSVLSHERVSYFSDVVSDEGAMFFLAGDRSKMLILKIINIVQHADYSSIVLKFILQTKFLVYMLKYVQFERYDLFSKAFGF